MSPPRFLFANVQNIKIGIFTRDVIVGKNDVIDLIRDLELNFEWKNALVRS